MIGSFKHKGLKRFYESGDVRGINPKHSEKIEDILGNLDTATVIEDMRARTFKLHRLKGSRKNVWAVTVSANWRITFTFTDGEAYDIHYEDYH